MSSSSQVAPPSVLLRVAAALAVASIPVIVDRAAIADAAKLYDYASSANPYWAPGHFALLYIRAPAVTLSACALVLAPGLLMSLTFASAKSLAGWIVSGFMLSTIVVSVIAAVVQAAMGLPISGAGFVATVAVCAILAASFTLMRVRAFGAELRTPWTEDGFWQKIAALAAPAFLIVALLAPKFHWENFNGDGAHTIEATLLLLKQPVPFFPADAGALSGFPGVTSFLYIYPGSWFVRLFGDLEASVRLPLMLYLIVLLAAIATFAEAGRQKLSARHLLLIWCGLAVYTVTMAFSATYSPYSADIALPATQDTLFVAMFLAYVVFFVERRAGWMSLAIVFAYASLPSASMLIVIWLLAAVAAKAADRRIVLLAAPALIACVVAGPAINAVLRLAGLPTAGTEYGGGTGLGYFAFLRIDDWKRLAFMVVPGGILPALSLLAWRRQDPFARAMTVTVAAYFVIFFIQASIALHYFVPAMLLPIAVFWRIANDAARPGRLLQASVLVSAAAALLLSLPSNARPFVEARLVGSSIDDRTFSNGSGRKNSYAGHASLRDMFPPAYDQRERTRTFVTGPLVLRYYSRRHHLRESPVNYVLQWRNDPAPTDGKLLASDSETALYSLSDSVRRAHVGLRPPEPPGSLLYEIPNSFLFRTEEMRRNPHVINVVRIFGSMGLDTARLRSIGARR